MNTIKTGLLIAIFNYSAFRFNWSMLEYYIFILLLSISSNQNDEVSLDVTKALKFRYVPLPTLDIVATIT